MTGLLMDWVELLVRWTHVICGIAWIGASFYFIALDASLIPGPQLPAGVKGDAWQVHGGGFYQIQKYLVAPAQMPKHLTWFKWEAYATWIFGFALLVLVYYAHAEVYLIDPSVMPLSTSDAVVGGAASLALGWIVYDLLCRSWFGRDTARLAATGFVLLIAASYGYTHVFSGRGAFIHIGALVGSIMVGNVFFIIMPNQRIVVADLIAGRTPDPRLGAQAKQRSIHNNYLTLPVVFVMLSNHYTFTYTGRWAWLTLACVFVASFLVRHWFNVGHTGVRPDWRLWPAAAIPVAAGVALTLMAQAPPQAATALAHPTTFAEVEHIVAARCQPCHAAQPTWSGIASAPMGVMLDTPTRIALLAPKIRQQAVTLRAMPLNNATGITDAERAMLADWIDHGAVVVGSK